MQKLLDWIRDGGLAKAAPELEAEAEELLSALAPKPDFYLHNSCPECHYEELAVPIKLDNSGEQWSELEVLAFKCPRCDMRLWGWMEMEGALNVEQDEGND